MSDQYHLSSSCAFHKFTDAAQYTVKSFLEVECTTLSDVQNPHSGEVLLDCLIRRGLKLKKGELYEQEFMCIVIHALI